MADFRTKLITLAGVVTMFAGMAHAQVTGCTTTSNAVFVAAEGTTEQVSDLQISCPALAAGSATMNVQVYLSPAVTITSATVGSGSTAINEATIGKGVIAPAGGALTSPVQGVVSGSSVSFSGIAIASGAPINLVITNIKINASQIATSSGAPTAVTETAFIGGTNVTPAVLPAANVAFATNGLTGVLTRKGTDLTSTSVSAVSICTGVTAFAIAAPAFQVEFSEGFATAFKVGGTAAANATIGSQLTNNSYTGFGVTNGAATNTATSGTRIMIAFNNIPANTNVYVPLAVSIGAPATSTLTLVTSTTGVFNAATGSTANGAPGAADNTHPAAGASPDAQLTVSNGSATAIYEETLNSLGSVELYDVPVYLQAGGAAISAPQSAMTATVSFAPIGASSNVPNFVSGSSTLTKSGPVFNACTTTLLFPFVTNQLGFDTGISIANASSDLLNGGTKSNASAQSGTCSLTFFGNTAPSAAVTTASVTTGTTYAAAASTLAPGFQGYMIANCNFLYGHGFAYVVYNLTQNNGAAMGYLADVINNDRKQTGTDAGISNTNPESSGN